MLTLNLTKLESVLGLNKRYPIYILYSILYSNCIHFTPTVNGGKVKDILKKPTQPPFKISLKPPQE